MARLNEGTQRGRSFDGPQNQTVRSGRRLGLWHCSDAEVFASYGISQLLDRATDHTAALFEN